MIDSNDVTERLLTCFRTAFPDARPEQLQNATTDNLSAWDSKMSLTLAMLIEEEFNIWIGDEAVSQMTSFAKVKEMVFAKL